MSQLNGKIALILGASSDPGMGSTIARRFIEQGATVLIAARNETALRSVATTLDCDWARCDITRRSDIEALIQTTLARHGKIDIAVNAAAFGYSKPFEDNTDEELDEVHRVLFRGPFVFLQALVKAMPTGGSIIMLSSAVATLGFDHHAAYAGAKAGIEQVVRCVANEYGVRNLRVNSIAPGLTDTGMTRGYTDIPGVVQAFAREYPLGRIGTSEDIAEAALFLAGDGCFMTGQTLQVNGGLTLRRNPTFGEIEASINQAATQSQT